MDYQSYDNNDLVNGSNNQNPNLVLYSNGETNFTISAPIQNNQNAEFTDFTHGNLAHDNLNQQGSFNSDYVGPNSMIQIGVNNQNFNLFTTISINKALFDSNSDGQNSMILTVANNNNNNMSTAYQGSQISNTYQNDQI
ncbi:14159_t:CDS:2, partial [Entrophospora sp. SA101]